MTTMMNDEGRAKMAQQVEIKLTEPQKIVLARAADEASRTGLYYVARETGNTSNQGALTRVIKRLEREGLLGYDHENRMTVVRPRYRDLAERLNDERQEAARKRLAAMGWNR